MAVDVSNSSCYFEKNGSLSLSIDFNNYDIKREDNKLDFYSKLSKYLYKLDLSDISENSFNDVLFLIFYLFSNALSKQQKLLPLCLQIKFKDNKYFRFIFFGVKPKLCVVSSLFSDCPDLLVKKVLGTNNLLPAPEPFYKLNEVISNPKEHPYLNLIMALDTSNFKEGIQLDGVFIHNKESYEGSFVFTAEDVVVLESGRGKGLAQTFFYVFFYIADKFKYHGFSTSRVDGPLDMFIKVGLIPSFSIDLIEKKTSQSEGFTEFAFKKGSFNIKVSAPIDYKKLTPHYLSYSHSGKRYLVSFNEKGGYEFTREKYYKKGNCKKVLVLLYENAKSINQELAEAVIREFFRISKAGFEFKS